MSQLTSTRRPRWTRFSLAVLLVALALGAASHFAPDALAQVGETAPGAATVSAGGQALEEVPGRWEGIAKIGIVIALFVVPIMVGSWLAKVLRMPEHGWKFAVGIGTLATAVVVLMLGEIKLGPDLSGGITLIYELAPDQADESTSTAERDEDESEDANVAENSAARGGSISRRDLIASLISVLQERIDPTGTKEVSIRPYGEGQVEIIIPKANKQELDYIERRISTAGSLVFRITASERFEEHQLIIDLALDPTATPLNEDVVRSEGREIARWVEMDETEFPTLEAAQARGLVTRTVGNVPQALVITDDGLNVTGDFLKAVAPDVDETGRPQVSFSFDSQGAFLFGQLTGEHLPNNSGQRYNLGILLDNRLLSAPTIESKITDRGRISGNMSEDEVNFLVGILQAGRLPAALNKEPISRAQISPTLGAQTIEQGKLAMGITMAMVAIFMIAYYRFAGLVACFAVGANLLLVLGVMVLIKGAFTMPGLAGLVLTVGMAVDSNVLIYERIREELQRGAALRMAIRNGYARAWITIFDSHVTTLLTAVVLYKIAPDSVKGFGVTLFFGILLNLFTAVFLTRIIFDVAERTGWLTKLSMAQWIRSPNIDFMGLRKVCITASLLLTLASIALIVARGKDLLDIDFTGGSSVTFVLDDANKMDYVEVQRVISESPLAGATLVEMDNSRQRYTLTTINDNVVEVEKQIADMFSGKLETYHVEISDVAPIPSGPAEAVGSRRHKPSPTWALAGTPLSVLSILQDNAEASSTAEAGATPPDSSEQSAVDSNAGDASTAAQAEDRPSENGESSSEQPDNGAGDGSSADSSRSAEAGAVEPSATQSSATPDLFAGGAQARLEFGGSGDDAGVNHSALEQMLKNSLEAAGKPDANFELSNPDYVSGSIRNFTKWDVKVDLPEAQARQVFEDLQRRVNEQPVFPLSNKVGGRVASRMAAQAVAATLLCCAGLVGFLWFRFHGVMYGIAAVIALIFDVFIVIGAVALSAYIVDLMPGVAGLLQLDKFKMDLALVAALLTLVGYCINDTIVVFDRIREVKGKSPRLTGDMINASINQTLSRTLLTGLTTIGSVIVLYIVAGEGIHGFAYSLFIGFIVGTFGSIFIASPTLLWLTQRAEATAARASATKAA
jgi:SecD/SecF fusion protein